MKMSKRLLFAVLLSAVVVWTVLFTWSYLEYRRKVTEALEVFEELGESEWVDVSPYHQWNHGGIIIGAGVVLVLCVICGSAAFKGKRKRKGGMKSESV